MKRRDGNPNRDVSNKKMGKPKLWRIAIHDGVQKSRIQVYADFFNERAGDTGTVECTFYLSKDKIDMDRIEEQAVAMAEDLLRRALSNG
ncbi:MAG TPA: hypothetical protein VNK81_07755 [Thermodesulfobacteriota bacterium]|nr:hypothetical protein [Thermodesulfobacteriota bacterium]